MNALVLLFVSGILIFLMISACNSKTFTPNKIDSSSTDNCRVIKQAMGETCVPDTPKRLAVLDLNLASDALMLGITPAGVTTFSDNSVDGLHVYLGDKLRGIPTLEQVSQPNIESIVSLKPDLIIGSKKFHESIYPLLSKIAPTILESQSFLKWRERFNFIAEVLDKQTAAQKAWSQYYQRMEELKTALGNSYKNKKISVVEFCCDGIYLIKSDSPISSIMRDAGLQFQEALYDNPYEYLQISEEELDKINGDILFVTSFSDSKSYIERLQKKPLWQKIKAVQQNKVYFVDGETWRGFDLLAANAVIDDLFKYLVNAS